MRVSMLFVALLLSASPASAGIILTMERTGVSVDNPLLTVVNEDPLPIDQMVLTIGDLSKNFDSAQTLSFTAGLLVSVLDPDEINNGLRSDQILWDLQTLTLNGSFASRLDIDSDVGPATVDWQMTLFNNGALPNALWTVTYQNGSSQSVLFHDEPGRNPLDPYVVTMSSSVPEPGSLLLLLPAAAIGAFLHLKKRRPS